jgi:hypothetical protein
VQILQYQISPKDVQNFRRCNIQTDKVLQLGLHFIHRVQRIQHIKSLNSKHNNLVSLFLPILQPHSRYHSHCLHPFQEKHLRHIAQSIKTMRTTIISPAASLCFISIIILLCNRGKDKVVMEIHSGMNVWLHLLT